MTTADDPGATPPKDELQFEQAEFESAPALTCAGCTQPINGSYYEAGGKVLCTGCRDQVVAQLTGGSGMVRFLRAGLLGSLAAVAGAALYYLVMALTGYHLSLLTIVIGIMVGSAVRRGSRGRGGWVYQTLAVFLTYTAIVSFFIPTILEAFSKLATKEPAVVALGNPVKPEPVAVKTVEPDKPDRPEQPGKAGRKPEPGLEKLGAGQVVVALVLTVVVVLVIAYAAPFLGGTESLILLLIIFFGLQQAWRLNKKAPLSINGPYQASGGSPPGAEVPAHA